MHQVPSWGDQEPKCDELSLKDLLQFRRRGALKSLTLEYILWLGIFSFTFFMISFSWVGALSAALLAIKTKCSCCSFELSTPFARATECEWANASHTLSDCVFVRVCVCLVCEFFNCQRCATVSNFMASQRLFRLLFFGFSHLSETS